MNTLFETRNENNSQIMNWKRYLRPCSQYEANPLSPSYFQQHCRRRRAKKEKSCGLRRPHQHSPTWISAVSSLLFSWPFFPFLPRWPRWTFVILRESRYLWKFRERGFWGYLLAVGFLVLMIATATWCHCPVIGVNRIQRLRGITHAPGTPKRYSSLGPEKEGSGNIYA